MKVDNPQFRKMFDGEVACSECPMDSKITLCMKWMGAHRSDGKEPGRCPDQDTYAEACALAEAAEKEGR